MGTWIRTIEDGYAVDKNGCWIWKGSCNGAGYGQWRKQRAHRVYYAELVGPVPDGMVLDHLCNVRRCVNPAHLEPVTNQENLRRARERDGRGEYATHCKYGHELTPENVYIVNGRSRACRECNRQSCRDRADRNWRQRGRPRPADRLRPERGSDAPMV